MITDKDKQAIEENYVLTDAGEMIVAAQRDEIAALKAELADLRLANLCHIDEKHLAQNERDALKAKIDRARAILVESQRLSEQGGSAAKIIRVQDVRICIALTELQP